MAEDKGLKNKEEEKLPSDNDQTEKKTPESEEETEEKSEETSEDDKVEISKSDLAKIKEDRNNYKTAFLGIKKKSKKSLTPEEPKKEEPPFDDEYVTKKELYKSNEQMAIQEVTKDNPDIDKNWDDVVSYYTPRRGKNSVESIKKDITDAYFLYVRDSEKPKDKISKEDAKESKKATSELSSLKSEPSKGKEKKPAQKKRTIIQKRQNMKSWYK